MILCIGWLCVEWTSSRLQLQNTSHIDSKSITCPQKGGPSPKKEPSSYCLFINNMLWVLGLFAKNNREGSAKCSAAAYRFTHHAHAKYSIYMIHSHDVSTDTTVHTITSVVVLFLFLLYTSRRDLRFAV